MRAIALLSLLLCSALMSDGSRTIPELKLEILNQILPKNENEIMIAPGNLTKDCTEVEATLYVLNIDEINELKGEITLRMYFRQYWKDYRLKYLPNPLFEYVLINNDDAIWVPDTFFPSEKKSRSFDSLRPNVLIKIFPDGSVTYSKKLSVTLNCPMDFDSYPFDRQVCNMRLESYGSTAEHMKLKWKAENPPVGIYSKNPVPVFRLQKLVSSYGMVHMQKNYSFLAADFYFSRSLNYSMYNIYLPGIAMVFLSWLPFWMNKKMITTRLLLSVGALLSFFAMLCRFGERQPQSRYSSSMLWFSGTCTSFLILSSVLSVLVHIFDRDNVAPIKIVENGEGVSIARS
uniref:Uncharacterized protein n=2 Tax=Photinus pyralis TaxID=7054 RepID=A0A1Y1NHW9_PHOPY